MFCSKRYGHWNTPDGRSARAEFRDWKRRHAGDATAASGNVAFDEYREETLHQLDEEQREFRDFLDKLRAAKDRAEFDQFMADRRNRPASGRRPHRRRRPPPDRYGQGLFDGTPAARPRAFSFQWSSFIGRRSTSASRASSQKHSEAIAGAFLDRRLLRRRTACPMPPPPGSGLPGCGIQIGELAPQRRRRAHDDPAAADILALEGESKRTGQPQSRHGARDGNSASGSPRQCSASGPIVCSHSSGRVLGQPQGPDARHRPPTAPASPDRPSPAGR